MMADAGHVRKAYVRLIAASAPPADSGPTYRLRP